MLVLLIDVRWRWIEIENCKQKSKHKTIQIEWKNKVFFIVHEEKEWRKLENKNKLNKFINFHIFLSFLFTAPVYDEQTALEVYDSGEYKHGTRQQNVRNFIYLITSSRVIKDVKISSLTHFSSISYIFLFTRRSVMQRVGVIIIIIIMVKEIE